MSWWWIAGALAQTLDDGSAPACDTSPLEFGEQEQYIVSSAPGDQAFSYIGHLGMWIRDRQRNIDHIVEFGAINSSKQEPLTALLMGDLQCWWRVREFNKELDYYVRSDRLVVARKVQLPPRAELAFVDKLYGAASSAGKDAFLFHWRERSCATEIRDILDEVTGGQISAQLSADPGLSARGEVLRHLGRVKWAWFGWSLLAGAKNDAPLTPWELLFAPQRLTAAVDRMTIRWPDGSRKPLISEVCTIHPGRDLWPPEEPPDHTLALWAAGLLFGGALARVGTRRRRLAGVVLVLYGLIGGLLGTAGMVLFAVSTLDAYGPNRNWLFINPLTFALVPLGVAWLRGRSPAWGKKVAAGLAGLGLLGLPLWLVPAFYQGDHLGFLGLFVPTLVATAWLARQPASAATSA